MWGFEDRGRIESGRRADLPLVNGNATEDIMAKRDISVIWQARGQMYRASFLGKARAAE